MLRAVPLQPEPAAGQTGRRAPAIALTTCEGEPRTLGQVVSGRIALLNFWATWCEACKEEAPALRRLHQAFGPHGVVVVGINLAEPPDKAAAFVRAYGLGFPNLCDRTSQLAEALDVHRLPATLILDAQGTIVHRSLALDADAIAVLRELVRRRRAVPSGR